MPHRIRKEFGVFAPDLRGHRPDRQNSLYLTLEFLLGFGPQSGLSNSSRHGIEDRPDMGTHSHQAARIDSQQFRQRIDVQPAAPVRGILAALQHAHESLAQTLYLRRLENESEAQIAELRNPVRGQHRTR